MSKFFDTDSILADVCNSISVPLSLTVHEIVEDMVISVASDMNDWYSSIDDVRDSIEIYFWDDLHLPVVDDDEVREILFWVWGHSVDVGYVSSDNTGTVLTSIVGNTLRMFGVAVANAYLDALSNMD